jgi:hypothetical protein
MTARKFDLIWVIVDRLCKSTHFIPVNTNYKVQKYAEIYMAHVLNFLVCRSLLGATTRIPRDSLDPQFGLSPAIGWPN